MFVGTPVGDYTCDAVPHNRFKEVKIAAKFIFKRINRLDSRFGNKALKSLLRVADANRCKGYVKVPGVNCISSEFYGALPPFSENNITTKLTFCICVLHERIVRKP
jgi:hypothetical protein